MFIYFLFSVNQGGVPFHPPPIIHQIVPSAIGVAIPPRIIQSNPNAVAYKAPEYYQQQEPIITKHVYFHSAPEDDEQPIVQIKQQIVPPQKHYKIIFIKAPASGIRQAVQVPAIPQVMKNVI